MRRPNRQSDEIRAQRKCNLVVMGFGGQTHRLAQKAEPSWRKKVSGELPDSEVFDVSAVWHWTGKREEAVCS